MKKIMVLLVLAVAVNLAYGQGLKKPWSKGAEKIWQEEVMYEQKGNDVYIPVSPPEAAFDTKTGQYLGEKQLVQISQWHQTYYKGFVQVWNKGTGRWIEIEMEGDFWYYTWKSPEMILISPGRKN